MMLNRRVVSLQKPSSSVPILSCPSPAPQQAHSSYLQLHSRHVRAASFLPDSIEDFLEAATPIASGLAILGTAALAVRSPAKPKPQEDGFDYGVMGVVSAIPLVNWTAWILPAIQQPDHAPLYYTYAAIYAVPLLLDGFDIEEYTLLMLALSFLHVQVQRVAATEPDTLRNAKPIAGFLSIAGVITEKVVGFAAALLGVLASDSKQIVQGPGSKQLTKQHEEDHSPEDDLELKEFDRQLMAREAARRQRQKQAQQQRRRKQP